MSFTKGFWVTIIILTLNRLQDTQRTPWAGSRAERGRINHPQLMLPPHHVPHQHVTVIQTPTARSNPAGKRLGFLDSWVQKRFLKLPQSAQQPLNAGERLRRALTPPLPFIPAPAPTQRRQLQFSPRLPRRQKLKTRFHWSTAWISWIPLLPAFSAFPGVNTVKAGREGMGRAVGRAAILCHPSDHASPKTHWRHLQQRTTPKLKKISIY